LSRKGTVETVPESLRKFLRFIIDILKPPGRRFKNWIQANGYMT